MRTSRNRLNRSTYKWSFLAAIILVTTVAAEGYTNFDGNELDCEMRKLALEFASDIVTSEETPTNSSKKTLKLVYDALELSTRCDENNEPPNLSRILHEPDDSHDFVEQHSGQQLLRSSSGSAEASSMKSGDDENMNNLVLKNLCNTATTTCIFVTANTTAADDHQDGSKDRPWSSIHQALFHARFLRGHVHVDQPFQQPPLEQQQVVSNNHKIVLLLRQGVHYLQGKSLLLTEIDSNLEIRGYPGENVSVSGGVNLRDADFQPTKVKNHQFIYVADLTKILEGIDLPKIPSLFTSKRRYYRARYPNSDPEIDQWGYNSPHHLDYSISGFSVHEWTMPKQGSPPNFTVFDFANDPPEGVPFKIDSTKSGYNGYASGQGGVCSDVWGEQADSYWCSNHSQGGWAFVDKECATTGQLQLPAGMTYNASDDRLTPIQNASASLQGGYVFAWHSQSWAMHMFEISSHDSNNATMTFAKGGGKQGGRNWCRCDQCTYVGGHWCGQNQDPPNQHDKRLISGDWMIENVLEFLDQPGEYFLDKDTLHLYVMPNATNDLDDLTIGIQTELIGVRNNAQNIRIQDLTFRDQAATFMEDDWSAPSGGDWSLHRGGAIFIENASNVTIQRCDFFRLDGNAIFLSRRTRNVHIRHNHFEWIGENAIATWGDTDDYDGTAKNFPMHTLIEYNVMRELGIYEKQSSAVGHAKAALTTIRKNIMFNIARAAINFNDMVGGGDVVDGNLIFNTCRESGDHGPINSWDRQAFLTTLKDGKTPSFDPLPRIVMKNFIIANYGGSQGIDNDDGSSWFHIHHNLFYHAYGFKMDYGGHDSVYEYNMAMSPNDTGGPCFGMGTFFEGHGDILRGNKCLLGLQGILDSKNRDDTMRNSITKKFREARLREEYGYSITDDDPKFVGSMHKGCENVTLESNEYYTPDGKAFIMCKDNFYDLNDMRNKLGLEINSTVAVLPDVKTILDWAKSATDFSPEVPTSVETT